MKTLLLMRHAKSSWKDSELADHDRPLNKRGKKDAPRMGVLLQEKELVPQRILCSSALRSRETAQAVTENSDFSGEIVYLDRLYMAETDEFLAVLRELPDSLERVMIIGHNPGLETLLQTLSGRIESLPTAVLAHLTLQSSSWAELNGEVTGEVLEIWRPKELLHEADSPKEKAKDKDKPKEKEKVKEKEIVKPKAKDKGKGKEKDKKEKKKKDK